MKRYLFEILVITVQLFMFYIYPSFGGPTDMMGVVLLLLIVTFILSLIVGAFSNKKIKYLYPIIVSLIFLPTLFIYYNISALIHALWYFVVSGSGLLLGLIISLIKKIISNWCQLK